MTSSAWIQLLVYMVLLIGLGWPLGKWMAAIAEGRMPRWLVPLVRLENALYRIEIHAMGIAIHVRRIRTHADWVRTQS